MAERQQIQEHSTDSQPQSVPTSSIDEMTSYVTALEAALLPCLPARELQAIDRSSHPSHPIDVERHARDFMEAAKKLQLYFISLQREDQPTRAETLRKEIAIMEEELKVKNELISKQETLIQGWREELKDQLEKHNTELERLRGYAAAAHGSVSSSPKTGASNMMLKKGSEESVKSSWAPDPVTGYYMPEGKAKEIDAAELREILLKNKTKSE